MSRFFIPEVVQTSAMDCGPASLKCLLQGHGIEVNYARLRDACQTDVDGTSIDTLTDIARQLGLEANQIMVPVEHLFLDTASTIPAIVVTRLPNSWVHFVVVWRKVGNWFQVMDPAAGRVWKRADRLASELYVHTIELPASEWRGWLDSEEFLRPLRARLKRAGVDDATSQESIATAVRDPTWITFAALDAATRMTGVLCQDGVIRRGAEASRTLSHFMEEPQTIPPQFWSVTRASETSGAGPETLRFRGAVFMRALRARPDLGSAPHEGSTQTADDLCVAVRTPPPRPLLSLMEYLKGDGPGGLGLVLFLCVFQALVVTAEALLFRSLIGVSTRVRDAIGQLQALGGVMAFTILALMCSLPPAAALCRFGRLIETRLRIAFLSKLPRLGDRYFQSRLASDMAERSHNIAAVRAVPSLTGQIVTSACELLFMVCAVIWLDPALAVPAMAACVVALSVPFLTQPILIERDLRVRTHNGALMRFYLDSMIGATAIRSHSAERALRTEQGRLLEEWLGAGLASARSALMVEIVQIGGCTALCVWMLLKHVLVTRDPGGALLLLYWGMNIPPTAAVLIAAAKQYPSYRNIALRVNEPLSAPDQEMNGDESSESSEARASAASIEMTGVSVTLAGHRLLTGINLSIAAGEKVAVVGPSGAGKSSLLGLLLGWRTATEGLVLIDGQPLSASVLRKLRQNMAWVDPAVHLWNQSLFDNLAYGAVDEIDFGALLRSADLEPFLNTLPDGLQTALGEAGALASGGEGQRVRLGRAMNRTHVGLVLLDEAFRGLDHRKRRELTERALQYWSGATLICVTHDVEDTVAFGRVLVIVDGRIEEDGRPEVLRANPDSYYSRLLARDRRTREALWESSMWRRLNTEDGRLSEQ